MTPADVCAWCSAAIADTERMLRFESLLYHPGCLIERRVSRPPRLVVTAPTLRASP